MFFLIKLCLLPLWLPFKLMWELMEHSGHRRHHRYRARYRYRNRRRARASGIGCVTVLAVIVGLGLALWFFTWPLEVFQHHLVTRQWVPPHWVPAYQSADFRGHMSTGHWRTVTRTAPSTAGIIAEVIWLPAAVTGAIFLYRYHRRTRVAI
jgi:ABC-type phosphate transport system permease subunit